MSKWPQLLFAHVQQDKCVWKLNTRWQRSLHVIVEKSAEPQLYLEKIENLNTTHPDWPFVLVRLGKAYLLLEDLHGALEQFEKALSLLSPLLTRRQIYAICRGSSRVYYGNQISFRNTVTGYWSGSLSVRTLRPKKVSSSFRYCLCDVTETISRWWMG